MSDKPAYAALVVDDNYFNRDLSALALKHIGFEVTEAEDGVEALEILKTRTFDMIVLDLAMPRLDGANVLRAIRRQPLHDAAIVVVMTANPHMAMGDVDNEADFVMHKPIDINAFARFAKRVAERAARDVRPQ